jgi:hypothetical protein
VAGKNGILHGFRVKCQKFFRWALKAAGDGLFQARGFRRGGGKLLKIKILFLRSVIPRVSQRRISKSKKVPLKSGGGQFRESE